MRLLPRTRGAQTLLLPLRGARQAALASLAHPSPARWHAVLPALGETARALLQRRIPARHCVIRLGARVSQRARLNRFLATLGTTMALSTSLARDDDPRRAQLLLSPSLPPSTPTYIMPHAIAPGRPGGPARAHRARAPSRASYSLLIVLRVAPGSHLYLRLAPRKIADVERRRAGPHAPCEQLEGASLSLLLPLLSAREQQH